MTHLRIQDNSKFNKKREETKFFKLYELGEFFYSIIIKEKNFF